MDANVKREPIILVVDDMRVNTDMLSNLLTPKGYRVMAAASGQQALTCVETDPPDVILLDLMMPGMDGFEVCQRLKQDPHTRHIPVIIISGLGALEANVRALEAGADDFLSKPFDSVLLSARLQNSLRSKMLQDQIIEYQHQLEESNRTLEQRVEERTAQLRRTQQAAIIGLAKLAESRDTETGAHLERMRSYARLIAREMAASHRLDDAFIEQLYYSSPLHDIGKVGVPDSILLKPGKLMPQEFDIMKTHALIGGDTLHAANVEAGQGSFLVMGRDIAYYHHERWDGRGYPFGIAKTDIPLAARIAAVSDVYDALSSKRPYKEAFSPEKSRAIILEGRGAAFDPEVVDAFVACQDAVTEIHVRFENANHSASLLRIIEKLARPA